MGRPSKPAMGQEKMGPSCHSWREKDPQLSTPVQTSHEIRKTQKKKQHDIKHVSFLWPQIGTAEHTLQMIQMEDGTLNSEIRTPRP